MQSAIADCSAVLMAIGRLPLTAELPKEDWPPLVCDENQWVEIGYTRNRLQTVEPVSSFLEIDGLWVLDNVFPIANGLFSSNHSLRVLEIKAGSDPKMGRFTYRIYQRTVLSPQTPRDPLTDLDIVLGDGEVRLTNAGELLRTTFRLSSELMESNRFRNSSKDSYREKLSPSEWREKQSLFYGNFSGEVTIQKGRDAILFSAKLNDGRTQYISAVKTSEASLMATVYTDRAIRDGISRSFLRRLCYINVFNNRKAELAKALAPASIEDVTAKMRSVFHHEASKEFALTQKDKPAFERHQAAFMQLRQSAEFLRMQKLIEESALFRCPGVSLG